MQIVHSESQPTDDKLSLKGARSRHVIHFKPPKPHLDWFSCFCRVHERDAYVKVNISNTIINKL